MKLKHRRIRTRACDDWYEDDLPYYEVGSSYELSDDAP